jgi:hypothetical protein
MPGTPIQRPAKAWQEPSVKVLQSKVIACQKDASVVCGVMPNTTKRARCKLAVAASMMPLKPPMYILNYDQPSLFLYASSSQQCYKKEGLTEGKDPLLEDGLWRCMVRRPCK